MTLTGYTATRIVIAAGVLAAISLMGAWHDPRAFWIAYLFAFLFWFSLAAGSLAYLMMYHLTGGAWAASLRPYLEAGAATLPWMGLLFIPILFGRADLYPWADLLVASQNAKILDKAGYLNTTFFAVRAGAYWALWSFLVFRLRRLSIVEERGEAVAAAQRATSAPGLFFFGLSITFAAFDWAMSLEPAWYSSMYGFLYLVAQPMAAVAWAVLVMLTQPESADREIHPQRLNDMGNLLLTFTILWAYVSFAQFLIIWNGNLPETAVWYTHRSAGGWGVIAVVLAVGQFAAPFALLLFRGVKRHPAVLAAVAALLLVMHAVDQYWLVVPAKYPDSFHFDWRVVAVWLGMGVLWLTLYGRALSARPLVRRFDPNLASSKHEDRGYGV